MVSDHNFSIVALCYTLTFWLAICSDCVSNVSIALVFFFAWNTVMFGQQMPASLHWWRCKHVYCREFDADPEGETFFDHFPALCLLVVEKMQRKHIPENFENVVYANISKYLYVDICLDFFHVNRLNCRRICPQWIQLTMTMNKNSCWPASVLQVLLVSDSLPEHSSYTVVIHSCHLSNQQPRKQHGRFVTSFDVTSSEHT